MKKKLPIIASLLILILLASFGLLNKPPQADTPPETIIPSIEINSTGQTTEATESAPTESVPYLDPKGTYDTKEEVALYIHLYGELPQNFMTKSEARKQGWENGALNLVVPGKCIGGDRFGNYEGILPEKSGRYYTECDIGTLDSSARGAKRIVFSNDGLIYYTDDHYESFELLYGDPE